MRYIKTILIEHDELMREPDLVARAALGPENKMIRLLEVVWFFLVHRVPVDAYRTENIIKCWMSCDATVVGGQNALHFANLGRQC